jgi:hypothetical protein
LFLRVEAAAKIPAISRDVGSVVTDRSVSTQHAARRCGMAHKHVHIGQHISETFWDTAVFSRDPLLVKKINQVSGFVK